MSDEAVRSARLEWELNTIKADLAAARAEFASGQADLRKTLADAKLAAMAAELADLTRQARENEPGQMAMADYLDEERRTRDDRATSEQLKQHSISFLVKAVKELQRRQRSEDHRALVQRTRTRVLFRTLSGLASASALAVMVGALTGTGGALLLTAPAWAVVAATMALLVGALIFLWASVDVPEPASDEDDVVVETLPPPQP